MELLLVRLDRRIRFPMPAKRVSKESKGSADEPYMAMRVS